ncbi:inositol 2-dehydrogenase [Flavobacteriaceae bacterium]|nr:inositol 2-dehydrogenase [Flavobacteriaceae bacterium]MDC0001277.1 inositol 2-dehydrogenase [Flavobacteriaceae bacterium]MDC1392987.1 inositol 2-dehydrogenase [Flavobacteriaceae bacterium]
MKTISIGIVGMGRIGKIHLTNITRYISQAEVVAVAHANSEAQIYAKQFGVSQFYKNIESLLLGVDVDAVIITSPTSFHAEQIKLVAHAGKAIFCEKPMDLSLAVVQEVVTLVETTQVHFMVGFNRRYDPNFLKIKKRIKKGIIGTPQLINITSRDPGPPSLNYLKTSGGLFLDMAIHDFDMASYLMDDKVESVYASATVYGDPKIKELGDIDTALTTLTFKKGGMASINNSRNSTYGYDQRIEVFGDKGMTGAKNKTLDDNYSVDANGFHSALPLDFFLERYADSYRLEMQEFISSLEQRNPTPISAKEGLNNMAISIAAKKSVTEKRVVSLSEIID